MLEHPFIICLMGPTACGKTDLAIELVQDFPCDIVSVDSAMVYRGMDIGTAKPSALQQEIAPHRLIDIRSPDQPYSAAEFCTDAVDEIENIIAARRIPLLVGGTMLYFHALQNGLSTLPSADGEVRAQLELQAREQGWEKMHEALCEVDPESAQRIHPNDPQRIQRALEVYHLTGKSLSSLMKAQQSFLHYPKVNIILTPNDRVQLHERIELRFQQMMEQGFLAEAEKLYLGGSLHADLPSMRCVGYRQAWAYFSGDLDLAQMQERAIIATRQLAKRQLTWLRRWQDATWFDSLDCDMMAKVKDFILK